MSEFLDRQHLEMKALPQFRAVDDQRMVTAALASIPAVALLVEMAGGRAVNWPALLLGLLIVPASLAIFATEQKKVSAIEPATDDGGVEVVEVA
jgi:hypothetical protein